MKTRILIEMHHIWSLAFRSITSASSTASNRYQSCKYALSIPSPQLFLELQEKVLQKKLKGEIAYCINLEFPMVWTNEKRQTAKSEEGDSP